MAATFLREGGTYVRGGAWKDKVKEVGDAACLVQAQLRCGAVVQRLWPAWPNRI